MSLSKGGDPVNGQNKQVGPGQGKVIADTIHWGQ